MTIQLFKLGAATRAADGRRKYPSKQDLQITIVAITENYHGTIMSVRTLEQGAAINWRSHKTTTRLWLRPWRWTQRGSKQDLQRTIRTSGDKLSLGNYVCQNIRAGCGDKLEILENDYEALTEAMTVSPTEVYFARNTDKYVMVDTTIVADWHNSNDAHARKVDYHNQPAICKWCSEKSGGLNQHWHFIVFVRSYEKLNFPHGSGSIEGKHNLCWHKDTLVPSFGIISTGKSRSTRRLCLFDFSFIAIKHN